MKANYGNWVPKQIIRILKLVTLFLSVLVVVFGILGLKNRKYILVGLILLIITIGIQILLRRFSYMEKSFDYFDENSISWKIINYIVDSLNLKEENLKILDVGCGSGALSIKIAKRYPNSQVVGIDKWGIQYNGEFSKELCENNAKIENVENIRFISKDARNLGFEKESFDVIVSNYVYHNISGDRNKIIKESLRTLKKGGRFYIHDIFTKSKYPRLEELIKDLKSQGYEEVEIIDTCSGIIMNKKTARKLLLRGSKLLYGKK